MSYFRKTDVSTRLHFLSRLYKGGLKLLDLPWRYLHGQSPRWHHAICQTDSSLEGKKQAISLVEKSGQRRRFPSNLRRSRCRFCYFYITVTSVKPISLQPRALSRHKCGKENLLNFQNSRIHGQSCRRSCVSANHERVVKTKSF